MVINVPADQPTINAALAVASAGDTIRVAATTCNESITIGTGLDCIRIIGAGIGKTIIDGTGLGVVNGIDIQDSSMVTLEKITVQNFEGRGILIQTSDNIINQVKSQNNQNNGMEIDIEAERNLIIDSEASFNSSDVNPFINGIEVNGNHNYMVKCKCVGNLDDGYDLEGSNNFLYLCLAKENGDDGFDVNFVDEFNMFICCQAVKNKEEGYDIDSNRNLCLWCKSLLNGGNGFELNNNENLLWGNEVKCNNGIGIIALNNNQMIQNKVVGNGFNGVEINGNGNIVDNNCIENNTNQGILINPNSIDNVIRSNKLAGNTPDIDNEGMNTLFDNNKCRTSDPAGLCQINNEVIVNEGESIQAAINAVTTTEGFTIRVGAGTFPEILNIALGKDRIRIIGAGQGKTIIDGVGLGGIGINIDESSFVTIENLTVKNCDSSGIRINTSDNILHCVTVFGNLNDGMFITGLSERNMIMNCDSSGNNGLGISVDGDHNYIICSQCNRNSLEGIRFNQSEFNLAFHNFCDGNLEGIEPAGENNFIISNCVLNNEDGIEAERDFNLFLWNKACNNNRDGIDVEDSNNLVWGNICSNNERDGIFIQEDNNRIIHNIIKNNGARGIRIRPFDDFNIIDNNTIINNSQEGILILGDNNKVRSNCLIGNNLDINDQGTNSIIDENKCQTSIPDGLCENC
ncbi:right-handed parallel beta-helix repeat-containing protein [Chengkuizengella sp. SCS-71B]|uniref:right-handed parallel beta-helix repeat-containing protein n=1 Tax=Chengkuizengella sp. SCS-71B TaxID=3115290 RepID=UPI0032C20FCE